MSEETGNDLCESCGEEFTEIDETTVWAGHNTCILCQTELYKFDLDE